MRLLFVVLGLGMCVAATAQDRAATVEDAAIAARVDTVLQSNTHLASFDIDAFAADAVVTLLGGVENEIQKELAGDLAAAVDGVRQVVNEITVVATGLAHVEKRSLWRRIEDRTVGASVRTRLLYHNEFKGLKIGARTLNGVITLTGPVGSEAQKRRIGVIAFETRGVDEVINELTVQPQQEAGQAQGVGRRLSDELVEKWVETSILLTRNLSIRRVDVEVDDGICILTGIVASEAEKARAGVIAKNIQGIRAVRNELKVQGAFIPALEALEPMEVEDDVEASPALEAMEPDDGPLVSSFPLSPR